MNTNRLRIGGDFISSREFKVQNNRWLASILLLHKVIAHRLDSHPSKTFKPNLSGRTGQSIHETADLTTNALHNPAGS